MVFAMAVIGAITRLTESGLSMVEWRPLIGWLPPLNETEWQRVYGLYKQSPEFAHKHYWMELADFKRIFFWEWLHRLWGRLIGLVFALPLLWFAIRKQIPQGFSASDGQSLGSTIDNTSSENPASNPKTRLESFKDSPPTRPSAKTRGPSALRNPVNANSESNVDLRYTKYARLTIVIRIQRRI